MVENALTQGHPLYKSQLFRVGQHQQCPQLCLGRHVPCARTKVQDVVARVKVDVAGLAGDAKHERVPAEGFDAGFVADGKVGRQGCW